MLKSFSLEGKVAVVTGGAGGFVYCFSSMEGGGEGGEEMTADNGGGVVV